MTRSTLRLVLWLASAFALAAWLVLALRTLTGSSPADPIEAAILGDALRLASGGSPYAEPSGAVPIMPGMPMLVSGLLAVFAAEPWVPRFVSLLATITTAVVVTFIVRRETQSGTLGMAGAALLLLGQLGQGLATTLPARPEPLMLLWALLGCQALRLTNGIWGALLAALCFSAATFTHVAGLAFAIAALLHLGVRDHRRFISYGLGLAASVCAAQLGAERAYGPWFGWAAWEAGVQAMRFEPLALLRYVGSQLLGTLGVFTLATVLSFALPVRPWSGAVGIWTWMAFAAVAAGAFATQGGHVPGEAIRIAAVALAIIGPVSVQRITQHLSNWPGGSRMGGQAVVLTALALQFVTMLAGTPG